MDGWFGDPRGRGPCLRCMCNGNIDENAVMNCDRMTGECLKCIYNTTGFHCESCLPGYFGKPVTSRPEERCRCKMMLKKCGVIVVHNFMLNSHCTVVLNYLPLNSKNFLKIDFHL